MSDAPHVHKFNATFITTRQNSVLRCACGAWTSKRRIQEAAARGEQPELLAPTTCKGLETRLKNDRKRHEDGGRNLPWGREKQKVPEHSPDTTAATDEVLRGTRKPT